MDVAADDRLPIAGGVLRRAVAGAGVAISGIVDRVTALAVPAVFVDSLAFMHRYSVVLWEELARLKTARQARSSRLSWWTVWTTSAHMIGELVIRAWDRAGTDSPGDARAGWRWAALRDRRHDRLRHPPAIDVRNLTFRYPNGHAALKQISFAAAIGERLAIVGPNGAGKSTLLLHLNGILPSSPVSNGAPAEVLILGQPVRKETLPEIRRRVGFVFQDPDDQLFCSTVAEDIAFGPKNFGLSEIPARVQSCLDQVGLPDHGARMIGQLSFGERKRVCLAGVLACDPAILVLDEPTANLDPRRPAIAGDHPTSPGDAGDGDARPRIRARRLPARGGPG